MVREFDPKKLTVAAGGVQLSGFAETDMITITPNKERAMLKVGVDGEGARVKNYDNSAEIKITLLQSSESNDILSAYALANSVFSFVMRDSNGTSLATALTCWVKRYPDLSFGSEVKDREWVLESDDLQLVVGSSYQSEGVSA